MRGTELSLAHSFSMENATQRGVFGKIFLRLAPGGARGDSFVRCHVKVIRLFWNFTPLWSLSDGRLARRRDRDLRDLEQLISLLVQLMIQLH